MKNTVRKGSRTIKDIPDDVLQRLNRGEEETVNLVEWLAVNQRLLLENVLKALNRKNYSNPIIEEINSLKKQTVNTLQETIGIGLMKQSAVNRDPELMTLISAHGSDVVRCWAAYAIGRNQEIQIQEKLKHIRTFAADSHFGVREVGWMAIRPDIAMNLESSISHLSTWVLDANENIRRFASEATRPRGVWCAHIESLKQNPQQALNLLEPLKSDSSKYVQDSVGNWLNDASKSQADFVFKLCARWRAESLGKETAYIVKKALRSLEKQAK